MSLFSVYQRCKTYSNLGADCVMVADPDDDCCQVPSCTYIPTPSVGPASTLTPPTVCPYPMPTAVPGTISGLPKPDPVTGVQLSNIGRLKPFTQQFVLRRLRLYLYDQQCSNRLPYCMYQG